MKHLWRLFVRHFLATWKHQVWVSKGYVSASQMIREYMPTIPILVGRVGGYRPDHSTPQTWRDVVITLSTPTLTE